MNDPENRFEDRALIEYARRALDVSSPSEVVDWAIDSLASGIDEERIVELAILRSPTAADTDPLLSSLLADLGIAVPSTDKLAWAAAVEISGRIASGSLDPAQGSRQLWRLARRVPGIEPYLMPFIGLASEWDDAPTARVDIEGDMIERARKFARSPTPPD